MWHEWDRRVLAVGNLKENDNFEDLGVDGRTLQQL
jgi:hypothetical protein